MITTRELVPHLRRCGYRGGRLRENYVYYEANQKRQVSAAGFSQAAYNAVTACIAVLDGNRFAQEDVEKQVLLYQSFGSPIVLVYRDDVLQFWHFSNGKPVCKEQNTTDELDNFFEKYKVKFSPESIFRAKTIGRIKKEYQLSFVDRGLMPVIEKREGEYLSNLIVRINDSLYEYRNKPEKTDAIERWLFQAGFWLIGAKILKDKEVEGFKTLDISNIESLIGKIKRHYGAAGELDMSKKIQKQALERVAGEIVKPVSSLSHITTKSLAYVYENALVSKKTRKALGTHATPSWLVNYIVWQLADWIEKIPQENRMIFEPACGHAPFLTGGATILSILYKGRDQQRHEYLKNHLIGLEKDLFAEEIARLALTLADIPNKNNWKIINTDIYDTDILQRTAERATILLCNPPFENFSKEEKQKYNNIETGNKAAEVLARTLPYMPKGSVFGVILPQGFLHKKNLTGLRKYILDNFELRTICNLPDNVFAKAGHISTVLLGRKTKSEKGIFYLRIPKAGLQTFADSYQAKKEEFSKDFFYKEENYSFRISELKEIWDYCREYPEFQEYVTIGRGIEYKDFDKSVRKGKFTGAKKGFGRFKKIVDGKKVDIGITELPDSFWMGLTDEEIKNPRYGAQIGIPQILANYIRSGGNVWRIKGLIEPEGAPAANSYLIIRPNNKTLSLYVIWALVNSPFTNAYMFDHCMERHNLEGILRKMPVPFGNRDLSRLENMVRNYFEYQGKFELRDAIALREKEKQCLLAIDAEVLRLYNLPPRLEKQLLDFFAGYQRKGVDFKFDRYYEEDFGSYIPLHIYISEEFKNSNIEKVKEWIEKNRTPEVIKAFDNAVKAFEGD